MINLRSNRMRLHRQINFLLILGIAVTLPFFININSYLVVLLGINWLAQGDFYKKWQRFLSRPLIWIILSFFILHVISLFYSNNFVGAQLLERKLAFLVLPVFMGTMPFSQKQVKDVIYGFAIAVTIASIVSVSESVYQYVMSGLSRSLFYHDLTNVLNISAIYMACYTVFSLFFLMHIIMRKWPEWSYTIRIGYLIWTCWLVVFLVLLSSKIFLGLFLILGNGYLFYRLYSKRAFGKVGTLLGINLLLLIGMLSLSQVRERFSDLLSTDYSVVSQREYCYDTPFTGTSIRLVIWRMGFEILEEKSAWFMGTGIGDAQSLLNNKYREYNLYTGNPELGDSGYLNYNTHNQYVQVLLELGFLGLLCWLSVLLFVVKQAWIHRDIMLLLLVLIMTGFGYTEVFLATHKGVVFFSFFISLLAFRGSGNR